MLCVQAWKVVRNGNAPEAVSGIAPKPSQRYRGSDRARRLEEAKQERSRRREEKQRAGESTHLEVGRYPSSSSALSRLGTGQTGQQHYLHNLELQVTFEKDESSAGWRHLCGVQISMHWPAQINDMVDCSLDY